MIASLKLSKVIPSLMGRTTAGALTFADVLARPSRVGVFDRTGRTGWSGLAVGEDLVCTRGGDRDAFGRDVIDDSLVRDDLRCLLFIATLSENWGSKIHAWWI
jgi:hypothetical protein